MVKLFSVVQLQKLHDPAVLVRVVLGLGDIMPLSLNTSVFERL